MVAARLSKLPKGANQHTPPGASSTQDDAATLLGVGKRTVQRARIVLDTAEPELQKAVDRGTIKVSVAADLAKLPPAKQREAAANPRCRHLDESQRAMVAARLAKLPLGANQHRKGDSANLPTHPTLPRF
jgi:hypothetical protein